MATAKKESTPLPADTLKQLQAAVRRDKAVTIVYSDERQGFAMQGRTTKWFFGRTIEEAIDQWVKGNADGAR